MKIKLTVHRFKLEQRRKRGTSLLLENFIKSCKNL